MSRYEKVRQRIREIITVNINALDNEIEEFEQKLADTQEYYGFNGPYYRQEQALGKRLRDKEALEDLLNDSNRITVRTADLRLNYFTCKSCGTIILSTEPIPRGYHECPCCDRLVYIDSSNKTSLEVTEDSSMVLKKIKEKLIEDIGRGN